MAFNLKRSPLTAALAHAVGTPMALGLAYHGSTRERLEGLDNVWGKHIDAETFERHLQFITRHYRVLPVSEIVQRLRGQKPLPRKTVFITFDDGYAGNYEVAFPLLKKYGVPASFYIATAFNETGKRYSLDVIDAVLKYSRTPPAPPLKRRGESEDAEAEGKTENSPPCFSGGAGGISSAHKAREIFKSLLETEQDNFLLSFAREHGFANADEVPELGPHTRFMTWEQMREMQAAGMEFGSHTHQHYILARVSENAAREELKLSKQILEENLGRVCEQFCYPNGSYPNDGNDRTNELVEEAGYSCAIYMSGGVNTKHSSPYLIRRHAVGLHTSVEELARILACAGERVRMWMGGS